MSFFGFLFTTSIQKRLLQPAFKVFGGDEAAHGRAMEVVEALNPFE
jgi:hypothetical protein